MRHVFGLMLTILAIILSCQRQVIEETYKTTALIPVDIDWGAAKLTVGTSDLYSASLWLFPKQGGAGNKAPIEYRMNNPLGQTIEVPVGKYDVLVFNNTVVDFSQRVGFRGTDKYNTFEFYALPDQSDTPYPRFENQGDIIHEPDILAVWRMEDFEVTVDMVAYTRSKSKNDLTFNDQLIRRVETFKGICPMRLTYTVFALVNVKNLCSATSAEGGLHRVAGSVLLADGKTSGRGFSHYFALNNRKWTDDNKQHGTIEVEFQSFGALNNTPFKLMQQSEMVDFQSLGISEASDAQYGFTSQFFLRVPHEGSAVYPTPPADPFSHDVTPHLLNPVDRYIYIEIGQDLPGDPSIELPEIGIGGGGFDPDVDDWGEPEIIPIE